MVKPITFLDLPAQQKRLGQRVQKRVEHVFQHCRFVMGPEVTELEERLASYGGARHAIGVSSGTDALLMVLMAEGIGPGMAVFLPAFTYTATAEVVLLLGAFPVFVDVDEGSFQISIASLTQRLSDVQQQGQYQPRAIIGVDLFGQPAPWEELRAFAQKHDLLLFADCAQSFGASYQGHKLGHEALATTLSFFPSKPLGAYGDGGAVLTDDDDRAALYRSLRSHGEGKQRYDVQRIGLNARLDTLQAAILLAKMEIFEEELVRRAKIADLYDAGLPTGIKVPQRVPDSQSAWAIYCITLPTSQQRDSLQSYLREHAVPTAIYYPKPLHYQPAYQAQHDGVSLPVSESLGECVLALPIHPDISDEQGEQLLEIIQQWAENNQL
ncbi:aminotransferase class I/II-fold pyridoxal phosphate-dependent enzyme [Saccharibacter sp. 17.LH.SD]|uniref:DegT/DnrJ/EryC1/StrS family aminotransferase n=1 Tax=Saccharibacter sp. 17.LH.SD TaxID=2689393 RepID=UPI00136981EA|nr:DegT/DnrJ/EryC1/StrS family aminotransferase [Saccharibacter sp. 17.LH.SD]MXV44180.1 aminotransferase class I/II-fold pyridoxal phosphate-dependent enzyme [Saccharibacter sp. 17.LH.SD]